MEYQTCIFEKGLKTGAHYQRGREVNDPSCPKPGTLTVGGGSGQGHALSQLDNRHARGREADIKIHDQANQGRIAGT
jgi:hypothetical protein